MILCLYRKLQCIYSMFTGDQVLIETSRPPMGPPLTGPEAPPTGSPPHLAESPNVCLFSNGPFPVYSKSLCPVFVVSPTLNPNSRQLLLQSSECPFRRASFDFLAT